MANTFLILAQAAPGGGGSIQWIFLILMVGVMYFLLIRPQQKQLKEHRNLIAGLKKGDDVVTQGGILGKIHQVGERDVQLEIASGVRIRVLKSHVQGKLKSSDDPALPAKTDDAKEERK